MNWSRLAYTCALLAILTAPAAASSGGWASTFGAPSVVTTVAAQKVLVVSVDAASRPAASALIAALRQAGLALVMDHRALGDVAALRDIDIVKRASNLPVERVAVVRDYGGSIVVSLYASDGTPKGSLTGKAGQPAVAGKDAYAGAAPPASRPKEPDVKLTLPARPGPSVQLLREYERKAIHWKDGIRVVQTEYGVSSSRIETVHLGRYGKALSPGEFYDAVGRSDLADEYRTNNGLKWGLGMGLGAALVIGGLVWMVSPVFDDEPGDTKAPLIGGSVLMGLGLTGVMVALFLNVDKHDIGDKKRMSDGYNDQLRRRMGIPERVPRLSVAPVVGPHGAGAALFGRY